MREENDYNPKKRQWLKNYSPIEDYNCSKLKTSWKIRRLKDLQEPLENEHVNLDYKVADSGGNQS